MRNDGSVGPPPPSKVCKVFERETLGLDFPCLAGVILTDMGGRAELHCLLFGGWFCQVGPCYGEMVSGR
jgi:hypothetical protein